jgi:nucleoid-associated protein YgaU
VIEAKQPAPLPVGGAILAASQTPKASVAAPAPSENLAAVEAPTVRVERGDSLWKLAKFYLGSGTRWRELAALNPEVTNPDVIRTGERIRVRVG